MKYQSFTTAAVQDERIRTRIKAALAGNLKRGEGEREFKKVVDDVFERAGYSRLAPHQVENIYQTNVSLAYGAGQMEGLVAVSEDFPYWKYSATLDGHTRDTHRALHGKIFRTGDFTFFPPIGFRCRCTAIPLTARQAGKYPKTEMPDADQRRTLTRELGNSEFLGDKQKKYMSWLAEKYTTADDQTRAYIDKANRQMRINLSALNKQSLEELLGTDYTQRLETEVDAHPELLAYAKKIGLNRVDVLRVYAYTDFENKLSSDLAKLHYSDEKPTQWTKNQLATFKRGLFTTLKKIPPAPGVVYRNLDKESISKETLKQWTTVGGVIKWDTFASTTQSSRVYSDKTISIKIKQKKGKNISHLSKYPEEQETLLLAETGFEIIDVCVFEGKIYIKLEEV